MAEYIIQDLLVHFSALYLNVKVKYSQDFLYRSTAEAFYIMSWLPKVNKRVLEGSEVNNCHFWGSEGSE